MRGLIALFLLVFAAVVVTLCVQNDENITLTLLAWNIIAPLWLVAVAAYVLGMLSGWGVAGSLKRSWQRVTEAESR